MSRWVIATCVLSALACETPPAPSIDAATPDASTGCSADRDCDDGVFCNGAERCAAGRCAPPTSGACAAGQTCVEAMRRCASPGCESPDADGDGALRPACGGTDCDDGDPDRFPGHPERCEPSDRTHDEDCDPCTIASAAAGGVVSDGDLDADGYVERACANAFAGAAPSCSATGIAIDATAMLVVGTDCADMEPAVRPGQVEACNAIDDDCDGAIDEGALRAFHPDHDGDRYGAMAVAATMACGPPDGTVENALDCDDDDASRSPSARESCNGIDDDCDLVIDEDAALFAVYADADGDGHGDGTRPIPGTSCGAPSGYSVIADDCNDADARVYPGAPELCDGLDDDCSLPAPSTGHADPSEDADGDGHSPIGAACSGGFPRDDCDDACSTCPGGVEICNGHDDDCDGTIDANIAAVNACAPDAVCTASAPSGCRSAAGLALGYDHVCALASTPGSVDCWGVFPASLTAAPIAGLDDVVEVSAGYAARCARHATGGVDCWGDNSFGQLGDFTFVSHAAPAPVLGIASAVQLSSGNGFECARLLGGGVRCWGSNNYGQLGDGTTTSRSAPVAVIGMDDAVEITSGYRFVCARRASGEVDCWGNNDRGQLGDGTTTSRGTPAAVVGLTGVAELSTGCFRACARLDDGTVSCWGDVGASPTPVAGIGDAIAIASACNIDFFTEVSCALHATGEVSCWGAGTLGDGTTTSSATPVLVSGLTDAIAIRGGYTRVCARRADQSAVCWGSVAIGDGTAFTTHATPVALVVP